ncbi:MerR family transcriptional regulator [Nannocystaceae bacterium ST9]
MTERWKVGELAEATKVTVRTLHWYEEQGLLVPDRNPAGHRVYGPEHLARLQRVLSLRELGLQLDDIRGLLDRGEPSPRTIVEVHLEQVRRRLAALTELERRLAVLAASLAHADQPSVADLLHTIEGMNAMNDVEKYYTKDQLEALAARRTELGEPAIHAVQTRWTELFAAFAELRGAGRDPGDPAVQALLDEADRLIAMFTGGDPGIQASLGRMWSENPDMPRRVGMDPEVFDYMQRARAARNSI